MSINVLSAVNSAMKKAGLNYEFGEWSSDIVYPYWVGEYQEYESMTEDGLQETSFTLTGFSRGKWLQLEKDIEKIKKEVFPLAGGLIVAADDGSVVAIFYADALPVPTGDAELKRIEVNLTVKEWRVI